MLGWCRLPNLRRIVSGPARHTSLGASGHVIARSIPSVRCGVVYSSLLAAEVIVKVSTTKLPTPIDKFVSAVTRGGVIRSASRLRFRFGRVKLNDHSSFGVRRLVAAM